MGTARVHEGVRRMHFESLVGRWDRGEVTQAEAAEMLGVSVRTFQRWWERFEEAEAGELPEPSGPGTPSFPPGTIRPQRN
jgi:transposase